MILKNRYFLRLSFVGKNYHGWQVQPNAITVQQVLNTAISKILREEISLVGAGRTDTGVHASYFIAHFDTESDFPAEDKHQFIFRINGILPHDIAINDVAKVGGKQHARFDAIERTYQYYVSTIKDPFWYDFTHFIHSHINIDKMNQAAEILCQYDNFKCFTRSRSGVKTYECQINHASWKKDDHLLVFTIRANRFLRNMVRAVVGTMLDIGFHKTEPDHMHAIISSQDRSNAGKSALAKGLFLTDITYPYTIF